MAASEVRSGEPPNIRQPQQRLGASRGCNRESRRVTLSTDKLAFGVSKVRTKPVQKLSSNPGQGRSLPPGHNYRSTTQHQRESTALQTCPPTTTLKNLQVLSSQRVNDWEWEFLRDLLVASSPFVTDSKKSASGIAVQQSEDDHGNERGRDDCDNERPWGDLIQWPDGDSPIIKYSEGSPLRWLENGANTASQNDADEVPEPVSHR